MRKSVHQGVPKLSYDLNVRFMKNVLHFCYALVQGHKISLALSRAIFTCMLLVVYYVYLSVCPSILPCVRPSVCLPIYLTVRLNESFDTIPSLRHLVHVGYVICQFIMLTLHVIKTLANTFNIEKKLTGVRRVHMILVNYIILPEA